MTPAKHGPNDEPPEGKVWIYCSAYRRRDGKIMRASAYGLVAWRFAVNPRAANDNEVVSKAADE